MAIKSIETAPQFYAHCTGLLYLAVIVLGVFSEGFVLNKLITSGDASATAQNILGNSTLWNVGVAANLLVVIFAVLQMWFEYQLIRPVNKELSLLFFLLNAVSMAVEAISKFFLLLVLPILNSKMYLQAFEPEQIHVFVNIALKSHNITFNLALIFFGLACLVNGHLIAKSGYFPKVIGRLLQLAGLCYLISCFAVFFAPALSNLISPGILLPVLIGESAFCLWLLIKGVDIVKWNVRLALNKREALEQCVGPEIQK